MSCADWNLVAVLAAGQPLWANHVGEFLEGMSASGEQRNDMARIEVTLKTGSIAFLASPLMTEKKPVGHALFKSLAWPFPVAPFGAP